MRSRWIALLTLMLLAAATIQSTLGESLTLFWARPDLVLLLVVTHSVARGVEEGLIGGILGGLMVDLLSAVPFGTATLGMALVGLATGLGEANVYRANVLVPLVAVFMATILYHSYLMLALQAAGWNADWISTLALQTVPGALLNALLAPLAFPMVRKVVSSGRGEDRFRW